MKENRNLILNNEINMKMILETEERPDLNNLYQEPFWDDPYISQQMLSAHLNPDVDSASYQLKTINQITEWLLKYLNLANGAKLLDLGCGPGLYSSRLSRYGLNVVGMDFSANSINYAKKYAKENNLNIQYLYQDYLTMDYCCEFDVILLIYCDFGALTVDKQDRLLQKIHKALKPEGVFLFDAFTGLNWKQETSRSWQSYVAGFWRPYPHLVLEQGFHYEEEKAYLMQYNVIDQSGKVSTYNIIDHYYSRSSIHKLMEKHGFQVQNIWSDLTGKPYEEGTKLLGIAAKKCKDRF